MFFTTLLLSEQLILTFAAITLMLSLFMLVQPRIVSVVKLFTLQGFFVASSTALVAYTTGEVHLYISAVLTLVLKVIFIPYLLLRMINKFEMEFKLDPISRPVFMLLFGGVLVIFCYQVTLPIAQTSSSITHNVIGISMAVVLMGFLVLVSRKKAITQVVGFMSIENGLFFSAISITQGMPMIVELGVAFDVLVAAVIFGVFFLHIKESIDSLDINELSRLSEKE